MSLPAPSPLVQAVHQAGGELSGRLLQALFECRRIQQLLPLQRQVMEQTQLLRDGESLLVSAPTASGKTMVAEWAMATTLGRSRSCLYLVPTRALAEQKTRELRAWLDPLGLAVACSTSEARTHDQAIAACQVDVVVSVYEKAFLLAPPSSSLWANLGLIVADEVQLLGDRERGPAIDWWLTRWRRESRRSRPHLVALSAVLGQPERLADWLGVRLVRSTARRLPLREGTLHLPTGRFRWRDAQNQEEGEETLIDALGPAGGDPDHDRAALALAGLAHRAGPVLVFCATRREAVGLAYRLAEAPLPTRRPAGAPWESLPRDQARTWLEDLMPCGVGVHTADLAPAHRDIVERAFEAGELSILVATPTLEQGVNLSAATVVSTGRTLDRDPLTGRGVLAPMGRARFANQGGRAGRGPTGVGRSMVLVEHDVEAAQVWRTLVTPEADRVESALGQASMVGALATLIGDGVVRTRAQALDLAAASLAAAQGDAARVARQLESDLDEGLRALLWSVDAAGHLSLTGLGEVLARTWVAPGTLALWRELLAPTERAPGRAACLLALALAEEWQSLPMVVEPGDRRGHRWPTGLVERLAADEPLARRGAVLLTSAAGVPVAHHRAARLALALDDWLAGDSLPDLERAHGLSTGLLHRVATTAAWLARAAMETAGALRRPAAVVGAFEELAQAIADLLRNPAFAIAPAVGKPAPPPAEVAPSPAASPPRDDVAMRVPVVAAQLVFPANDPGCVVFCGRRVALTPTEYRLLDVMARAAGRTITYAEIDAAVWPDAKVCRDQVRQHRNALEAKLGPAAEALFRTRRRWGIEVLIDPAAIRWDADADRAAG